MSLKCKELERGERRTELFCVYRGISLRQIYFFSKSHLWLILKKLFLMCKVSRQKCPFWKWWSCLANSAKLEDMWHIRWKIKVQQRTRYSASVIVNKEMWIFSSSGSSHLVHKNLSACMWSQVAFFPETLVDVVAKLSAKRAVLSRILKCGKEDNLLTELPIL